MEQALNTYLNQQVIKLYQQISTRRFQLSRTDVEALAGLHGNTLWLPQSAKDGLQNIARDAAEVFSVPAEDILRRLTASRGNAYCIFGRRMVGGFMMDDDSYNISDPAFYAKPSVFRNPDKRRQLAKIILDAYHARVPSYDAWQWDVHFYTPPYADLPNDDYSNRDHIIGLDHFLKGELPDAFTFTGLDRKGKLKPKPGYGIQISHM